jgi:hypothetical protein
MESRTRDTPDPARGPPRLGGPKQRAVLALLLQNANRLVSIERLIDELWRTPPARPDASVRAHVARLRTLLAGETDGRALIETWRGAYLLRVDPETQRSLEERLQARSAPSAPPPPLRRRPRAVWRILAPAAVAALALAAAVVAANDPVEAPRSTRGDALLAIDARTNSVLAEMALAGRPSGIAAGAGSVWVGDRDHRTLLRVRERRVVERIGLDVEPMAVALGAGSVWVLGGNGVVQQIDPARNAVLATMEVSGELDPCCADDIAFADGAVWVSRGGLLVRIDPKTRRVAGTGFHSVRAIGSTGRELWGVLGARIKRIRQLVPLGDAIRLDDVPPTERLAGLTADRRSLWIGSEEGRLRRVEPGAGRVAASLSLKRPITDVAVSSGVVWVALRER